MSDVSVNERLDAANDIAVELQSLAAKFKALSHPKRLGIFDMLMEGVHCNCEISERLDLSLSLVSHHMRILEEAGLVDSERDKEDARWIYYTINREALEALAHEIARFLDASRIKPRVPSCGPSGCTKC